MASEIPPPASHRNLRRIGAGLLTVVIALGAVVALLLVIESRDRSAVDHTPVQVAGPGRLLPDEGRAHLQPGERPARPYGSDPPASGPHHVAAIRTDADGTRLSDDQLLHALELGDIVLLYGTPRPPAGLRALANDLAGPFDPAIAASGQAVVLGYRPGTKGVVALAWRHVLRVPDASDPALRDFADFWLGRGAGV